MTHQRSRGDQGGFTLLELLVALALSALISLLLLGGVGLAARGLDRLSVRAERLDERRSIEMLMRRAAANVVTLPVFDGEPGFVGRPTSVSFLSTVPDGGAGLYRIRLGLGSTAVLTLSRQLAGRSTKPRSSTSVLMRNVRSFTIDYFGASSPAAEARWHHDWEGIATLPLLVRITLEGEAESARPTIILRLGNAG